MLTRPVRPVMPDPSTFFIIALHQCAQARREILEKLDADINSGMPVYPEVYGQALNEVFQIESQVFWFGGKIN